MVNLLIEKKKTHPPCYSPLRLLGPQGIDYKDVYLL